MLTQMSHDPAERELYEVRRKAFLDYNTNILGAREEGKEEGREEGIQTGQRTLLLELGATKFGELPPWVTERVRGASEQQLQAWAKTILAANTLEEWPVR